MKSASTSAQQYANKLDVVKRDVDETNKLIQKFVVQQKQTEITNLANGNTLNNLKNLNTLYNDYKYSLEDVSNGLTKCGLSQEEFLNAVKTSNSQFANWLENLDGSERGIISYAGQLAGATAKTIGLQIATTALNAAISMGISFLVSGAVQLLDEIIVTEEELIEKSEEAADKISELSESFNTKSKNVSEISQRFAELSQEVDSLTGKNLTLNTDEYNEFLDLSNQLAEIFPTLSRNYDENGNAIVNLSGDVDTIIGSLNNLLEVEKQITNQEIAEKLPDLYKGAITKSKNYNNDIDSYKGKVKELENTLDIITDDDFAGNFEEMLQEDVLNITSSGDNPGQHAEIVDAYLDVLEQLGLNYEYLSTDYGDNGEILGDNYRITDFAFMSDEEIEEAKKKIQSGIQDLAETYTNEIDNYNQKIQTTENKNKANWSSVLSSVAAWLSTDTSYQSLSDDMQAVVQSMVNNIDFSSLNFKKWEDVEKYIQDNIIGKIQDSSPEVQQAFADLFSIKTEGKTTQEYLDAIKDKAQYIADNSDFEYDDVLKDTGYQDIIDQYETSANDIVNSLDGVTKEMVYSLSPDEVTKAFDYIKDYGIDSWSELIDALENNTFEVVLDLETEKTGIEALNTAITESASATGLSAESIKALTDRYKELNDFDAVTLFEKTTNGIHLNTKALRELEDAYKKQNKEDINNKLSGLTEQYSKLNTAISETDDAVELADLYAQRDNIVDQIQDTAELASMYDGLTSAYKRWEDAQSNANERDMYEGIISGKDEVEDLMSRGWVDDSVRAYVDLLSNKDLATATTEEIIAEYNRLKQEIGNSGFNVFDFFTVNDDGDSTTEGIYNFFDTVRSVLGETYAWIDENGGYHFDFGEGGDEDVAEKLGIDVEALHAILKSINDVDNVTLDSVYTEFDTLIDQAHNANEVLKELGMTDFTFNFESTNVSNLDDQITEIKGVIDKLEKNDDGTINIDADGAKEALAILTSLLTQKQTLTAPQVMHVDTTQAQTDVEKLVLLLQNYQTGYNDLEINAAIGADTTEAQTNIQNVANQISEIPEETQTKLGLNDEEFQAALTRIKETDIAAGATISQEDLDLIQSKIKGIDTDMLVTAGIDSSIIDNYDPSTDSTVTYTYNKDEVDGWNFNKEATITYTPVINSVGSQVLSWVSSAFGGAKAQGTAFAKGNFGAKRSGKALGGELGQEMVVRNGRYFTIGDDSAEFFDYQKDDIIFDAEQTEQILKNGKITRGKKRGKSYAEGNAFSSGTSLGRTTVSGSVSSTSSNKNKNDEDDKIEAFDWIEIAIDRIERAIDRLKKTAESTYKSLKSKLGAAADEISMVNQEIAMQQQAFNRYMQEANSVGLDADLAEKVRNGSIQISDYDEDTRDLISQYQEFYEKALDCETAIDDLHESLASLYEDNFNNTQEDFENQLALAEHLTNQYENGIDLLEARGYLESTKYYSAMQDATKGNIAILNKELAALEQSFSDAMNSGEIEKYSESWFEMQDSINGVKEEIAEANVELAEYAKTMREVEWSYFDYTQERISQLTQEADFLIDLLSNSDLHTDKGQLTDEGMATMGLHGQNYNTYMAQSDMYAQEILEIDKELAKDPYNTELIERREELLGLQQDSILAAEDEKQAIVALVEEGINLELQAMQDLIDKYTESLDTAKD